MLWAATGITACLAKAIVGEFDRPFLLGFCVCGVVPFGIGLALQFRANGRAKVLPVGTIGFLLLYGYACLTISWGLVYVLAFPGLFLLILYQDGKWFGIASVFTFLVNLLLTILGWTREGGAGVVHLAVVAVVLAGCCLCLRAHRRLVEILQSQNADLIREESERMVQEERYRYTYQDALTGLGNRNAYQKKLESMQEAENPVTCVVMIDVNGLKTANDLLGQFAGDELLLGMTDSICQVFTEENSVFRLGGDEFLVFSTLPEAEAREKVAQLEEKVNDWRGVHIRDLSAAIGYAFTSEQENLPLAEIIKIADERMYTNKRAHYSSSQNDRRHR